MVMRRKASIHAYSRRDLVYLGLITSVYVVTGQIGLFFATEHGNASLVWPPAGIALAALMLYGYRFWPGIFLGTVLLNLTVGMPLVVICSVATGNVLGVLLGTYLLKRLVGFRAALERLQDALGLIMYAAGISTLISPTFGIIGQLLTGGLPWEVSGLAWLTWWMGDVVGVLLIAPVILSWAAHPQIDTTPRRLIEAGGLLFFTILISTAVYSEIFYRQTYLPLTYTIFPLVIWAALRFGQRGATAIACIGSSIAVWGAVNASGPFLGRSMQESLLLLQSFMGIVAVTALILAAIISERKHAQAALQESETRYRSLMNDVLDSSNIGTLILDAQLRVVWMNQAFEHYFGLNRATLIGQDMRPIMTRQISRIFAEPEQFAVRIAATYAQNTYVENFECHVQPDPQRDECWLEHWSHPIKTGLYAGGRLEHYYDITARKRTEDALQENQRFIHRIADATPAILYLFDLVQQCNIYSNHELGTILGYTQQELQAMGMSFFAEKMHPADLARLPDHFQNLRALTDDGIVEHDYRIKHADGTWRWLFSREVLFSRTPEGQVHVILGTAQDITVRKQAEEQIKASLREKEVLLKEIHHRVKNNLQVISSLFRLQSRYTNDRHALEMFRESQDRVQSMALVHQKLYQSADLARIDFAEYLRSLTTSLLRSYQTDHQSITLTILVDDLFLDIDQAIPCGLIINELVSNSLKYAFPDNRTGAIQIELRRTVDHQLTLTVHDNGIGLPPDIDLTTNKTLGLQLASTLTNQLGGSITIDRHGGTTFVIIFTPVYHEERENHYEYS